MNENLQKQINEIRVELEKLDKKKRANPGGVRFINFSVDLIANFLASGIIFYIIFNIEKKYFNIHTISNIINFFILSGLFFATLYLSLRKFFSKQSELNKSRANLDDSL